MTAELLDELSWRGLVAQTTDLDDLRKALSGGPLTLYCGFDPTAPSLHVGNLVQLLTLRRFQLAGHRPIALSGGATGLVGDPSGRSRERTLHTTATVAEWMTRIRGQLERFLDFGPGPRGALLADNLDWIAALSAIDFLRDVGKHFSVNQMLAKEAVSSRLGVTGMSFTEFSYILLQSYDYLQLYRRHDCRLQVGGNDQWGNITAGLDLIRRVEGGSAHALTTPLITTTTGQKFGKSTGGGGVWLDPDLTSPYAFYQYWVNADDRDVIPYLKTFTFLSRAEIEALAQTVASRPQARQAQRRLAAEMTTLVHGPQETGRVVAASEALFGRAELRELDERTLLAALTEAGLTQVGRRTSVVELLVATGLCASRSDARRLVDGGGVSVNNAKATDPDAVPRDQDLLHGRYLVLRRGRRQVAGVELAR